MDIATKPDFELGDPVITADGSISLLHSGYGEKYHSTTGARQEVESLYLHGSGFMTRLGGTDKSPLCILDVGLGLGYTAIATIGAWQAASNPPPLTLISLELNPLLLTALVSGEAEWMGGWTKEWRAAARGLSFCSDQIWRAEFVHMSGATLRWEVRIGDAVHCLFPPLQALDYIWQDPFSPKKNSELWTKSWFEQLHAISSRDTVLVTYSVARIVRDNLSAASWQWQKLAGEGNKRYWLKALWLEEILNTTGTALST